MKIIELRAENIKRLVCVTIKPDGNIVEITGRNGQGKTSVLDAIWWALEGQKNIQSVPIRKGSTSAKIRLDLGELKVTRTFKQSKETGDYTTSIVVEDEKGARFPGPQAVIDALLGALSFDPLAFTRMKPADQLEALKRFVPGVDFDTIERDNARDYAKRTDVNRRIKELRAQESGIVFPANAPKESVDESALTAELEAAGKQNGEIETEKVRRQNAAKVLDAIKSDYADNQRHIAGLRNQIEIANEAGAKLMSAIENAASTISSYAELPTLIDTAGLRQKIDSARKSNRIHSENERAKSAKMDLRAKADLLEKDATALTEAIEARRKQKADAIASAQLPIEGIGFGDGAVLMNGVPFEQASDAEQLRASIGIAAAMNPKLRVIRVRDGSLLDADAMKLLTEFADASDMQVWIERVDSSGKVGFVLEDGQIKEQSE